MNQIILKHNYNAEPLPLLSWRQRRADSSAVASLKRQNYINLSLLALTAGLLIFYIIQMNHYISSQYRVQMMQSRLSSLLEENNKFQSEKFQYDGIPQIARFAEEQGMVEANNVAYIFEAGSVAQR